MSTINPILEKPAPKQLNDLCPVALTSLVMKTLEKIVKSFILTAVQPMLDPLQFAHRTERVLKMPSCSFWISCINTWIKLPQSHAWILFADFSSALQSPMQSHNLALKLISNFSLQHDLLLWIVNFCNKQMSTSVCEHVVFCASCRLNWIPGVCPSLSYILYMDDCHSNQENSYLVRFADDSALLSLLGTQDGHGTGLYTYIEHSPTKTIYIKYYTKQNKPFFKLKSMQIFPACINFICLSRLSRKFVIET